MQSIPLAVWDPELGQVVSEWKMGPTQRVALGFLALLLGGIIVLIGASTEQLPVMILGGVVALGLIGLAEFFQSGVRVVVYTNGIERRGRTGSKRVLWKSLKSYSLMLMDPARAAGAVGGVGGVLGVMLIRAMFRSRTKNVTPRSVIILDTQGARVVIPQGLKGYKELVANLVPSMTDRLYPAAERAFNAGEVVSFGDALSTQRGAGFTMKGAFGRKLALPMEEFAGATLEGTGLVFHKKDKQKWHTLEVARLLNIGVFERLFIQPRRQAMDPDGSIAWSN